MPRRCTSRRCSAKRSRTRSKSNGDARPPESGSAPGWPRPRRPLLGRSSGSAAGRCPRAFWTPPRTSPSRSRTGQARRCMNRSPRGADAAGGSRPASCLSGWWRLRSRPRTVVSSGTRAWTRRADACRVAQRARGRRRRRRIHPHPAGRQTDLPQPAAPAVPFREAARDAPCVAVGTSPRQARDPRALPEPRAIRPAVHRRGQRQPGIFRSASGQPDRGAGGAPRLAPPRAGEAGPSTRCRGGHAAPAAGALPDGPPGCLDPPEAAAARRETLRVLAPDRAGAAPHFVERVLSRYPAATPAADRDHARSPPPARGGEDPGLPAGVSPASRGAQRGRRRTRQRQRRVAGLGGLGGTTPRRSTEARSTGPWHRASRGRL